MSTRQEVYAVLDGERDYQVAMAANAHGDPTNDRKKSLEEFLLYMHDYLNEAMHQASRTWGPDAYKAPLDTLRKVTAIGVAAMETWGALPRTAPTKHDNGVDLT